jgi:hypothetical protein
MGDLSERHEVRIRGEGQTLVFTVDSEDGCLVIRQERDGRKGKEVCSISLADVDELKTFFQRPAANSAIDELSGVARQTGAGASTPRKGNGIVPKNERTARAMTASGGSKNPSARSLEAALDVTLTPRFAVAFR